METKTLQEKNFKDLLINQIWRLIGMVALGFLFGYLVYRDSEKDGNPQIIYLFIIMGICFLIGIIIFLIKIIPAYKKIKKNIE